MSIYQIEFEIIEELTQRMRSEKTKTNSDIKISYIAICNQYVMKSRDEWLFKICEY